MHDTIDQTIHIAAHTMHLACRYTANPAHPAQEVSPQYCMRHNPHSRARTLPQPCMVPREHVCACACVRVCARVCVCVRVRVRVHVSAVSAVLVVVSTKSPTGARCMFPQWVYE